MLVSAKNKHVNEYFSLTLFQDLLINKGFEVYITNKQNDVREQINEIIPDNAVVGLGTSLTLGELNILQTLRKKCNMIYGCWNGSVSNNRSLDTFEEHIIPGYYITIIDALTLEGDLIDTDYSIRAASKNIFTPKSIFLIPFHTAVIEKNEWHKTLNKVVFRSVPKGLEMIVLLMTINY